MSPDSSDLSSSAAASSSLCTAAAAGRARDRIWNDGLGLDERCVVVLLLSIAFSSTFFSVVDPRKLKRFRAERDKKRML